MAKKQPVGKNPKKKSPRRKEATENSDSASASTPQSASPGRPTKYTPELVEQIGLRLGQGEPLAQICRDPKIGVDPDTVRNWMAKDEDISRRIARAREEGEESIAFRIRNTARGKDEAAGGDSTGDVQRDKLIIDTDLKLLAKWNPRKWGDKVDLNHGGSLTVNIKRFTDAGQK